MKVPQQQFNIGDTVKIRILDLYEHSKYNPVPFGCDMLGFEGFTAKIVKIQENAYDPNKYRLWYDGVRYTLDIDNGLFSWTNAAFVKISEDPINTSRKVEHSFLKVKKRRTVKLNFKN